MEIQYVIVARLTLICLLIVYADLDGAKIYWKKHIWCFMPSIYDFFGLAFTYLTLLLYFVIFLYICIQI